MSTTESTITPFLVKAGLAKMLKGEKLLLLIEMMIMIQMIGGGGDTE